MAFEKVTVCQMTHPADYRRAIPADAAFTTWIAPDGWRHRRFDWPNTAARGRILVQGGRADIVEKYLETIAHLHGRGWSVTTFDWRGQGGSGRLSANPHVGHATDLGAYVRDLADFWRTWEAEGSGPPVLLGHSMGGHIVLRALLERVVAPAAAVLVAPMIAIRSPMGARMGEWLATRMAGFGDPARAAWKVRTDKRSAGHRQQLLTHDLDRFGDEAWWYEREPDLLLGPPSWAWVVEAFRAGRALQADARLDALDVPILMMVADHDGLTDARAAVALAAKLPDVRLFRFGKEAAHELLREADPVRGQVYTLIDRFLDERAR